jgi:hypothetical protein
MFGIKHRHKLIETSRKFCLVNPNRVKSMSVEFSYAEADKELMDRLLFGVTSIIVICVECGHIQNIVVIGDHTKEGVYGIKKIGSPAIND